MTITEYLDAKYSAGGPGSERFEPDETEVHSSQVADCQRKRYWKHDRAHHADPSPYFELGRMFELMYGAALAFEHDPAIDATDLKRHPPWEVAEASRIVHQDVGIEVELDGFSIVGECDWVVLEERPDEGVGAVSEVTVARDGSRRALHEHGDGLPYEGQVKKVVETKTKKDLSWVRRDGADQKHKYQVYPYLYALDCAGEVAYMQRNDWEEHVEPVDLGDDTWTDVLIRARQHARNMAGDEVPAATPMSEGECKFCPYKHECANVGGSPYL